MTDVFKYILLFIGLLFVQIVVLNNVLFGGYINPMLYILFVLIYPLKRDRGALLFLAFLLGLIIDFFLDSGGVNAAATVFIAYIRLPLLKGIINKTEIDFLVFKVTKLPLLKWLSYVVILTFVHHFIVFSLDFFKFNAILTIFSKTFFTSIFTIILLVFSIVLMNKDK